MGTNPNFPSNLDIRPNAQEIVTAESGSDRKFDASAQEEAIREYGIAGRVWEAAYAMKAYLSPSSMNLTYDPPFRSASEPGPSRIIELGSGTGIIAAQLAQQLHSGCDLVVATDLPEVCPLLEKNLCHWIAHPTTTDARSAVLVRPLAWGDRDDALAIHSELHTKTNLLSKAVLTHIVCSDLVSSPSPHIPRRHAGFDTVLYNEWDFDRPRSFLNVVYFPELLAPLLRSLIDLTSPPFASLDNTATQPAVVISYKIRSLAKETAFWSAFGLWFTFEPVLEAAKASPASGPDWRRFGASSGGEMFIFVGRRRPESLAWIVPENDEDLLGGVGAWGTNSRKGDGTFESLLLMNVDLDD
ncbi:hypothetical protein EIP91_005842 [Steccherinum ochraceum]|uniref:Uncharacterized protein n=1 Tax=Steccherinum ochraceum TaxID=92696 RepID=A0A4R0R9F1_9APHY|nr:hypothetical protein EIP91_005842 [Steccherinum ochraceum]